MKSIANGYAVRETIKSVGGRYNGATKTWTVTDEQYEDLLERVAASAARSNRKDTQLARDWGKVVVEDKRPGGGS